MSSMRANTKCTRNKTHTLMYASTQTHTHTPHTHTQHTHAHTHTHHTHTHTHTTHTPPLPHAQAFTYVIRRSWQFLGHFVSLLLFVDTSTSQSVTNWVPTVQRTTSIVMALQRPVYRCGQKKKNKKKKRRQASRLHHAVRNTKTHQLKLSSITVMCTRLILSNAYKKQICGDNWLMSVGDVRSSRSQR